MSAIRLYCSDETAASSPPPFRSAAPTVKSVIEWYTEHNPRPSRSVVAETERRRLYRLFIAAFGARLVAECRAFELAEFIAAANLGSNWTKRRWNSTIQRPFNVAAKLGLIDRNTFTGVSYPEGREGRDWTDDEYRAMLRGTSPCFRRVLIFMRFSGLRPGEVRQLKWPDIRYALRSIVIDESRVKTGTRRVIPFNGVIVKLLAWNKKRSQSPFVFVNSRGKQWSKNAMGARMSRLRLTLNLPEEVKCHGGRHTFATKAVLNGVDVSVLSQILGHKTTAMCMRYVHLADKTAHLSDAMEAAVKTPRKVV